MKLRSGLTTSLSIMDQLENLCTKVGEGTWPSYSSIRPFIKKNLSLDDYVIYSLNFVGFDDDFDRVYLSIMMSTFLKCKLYDPTLINSFLEKLKEEKTPHKICLKYSKDLESRVKEVGICRLNYIEKIFEQSILDKASIQHVLGFISE